METKDMTGRLFKQGEKRSSKSPDYKGELTVAGVTYKLAGWVREARSGEKYIGLALREDQLCGRGPAGT